MQNKDFSIFRNRRTALLECIKNEEKVDTGIIILLGSFESERYIFRQESSFYYLTGIVEPAAVVIIHFDGRHILYLPNFGNEREKWVNVEVSPTSNYSSFGFDKIEYLNSKNCTKGFSYQPFFDENNYTNLLKNLQNTINNKISIFSLLDKKAEFFEKIKLFESFEQRITGLSHMKKDISSYVNKMRSVKTAYEISLMQQAVDITIKAHKRAAQKITPGMYEYQIQAEIEHSFTYEGSSQHAFPSVIATGKNTTMLHYVNRNQQIKDGDLVIIDSGTEIGYYASDITRTFPASGKFSKRQKEVYQVVLDTQNYTASIAKPGMFLRNNKVVDQSLHHLATKFLEKSGYAHYFPHGIGHYLGMDVHDVGDYDSPLKPGNTFTIEPGIYISNEKLGVRIEDNYHMTESGAVCLSATLPKKIDAVEAMMYKL
jgi:Xaa-Pro aminopeptidase